MILFILAAVSVVANVVNGSAAPIHALSNDILKRIFIHYLEASSQIPFYKTCKRFFHLLRPSLDPESFLYVQERPILKIMKLYMAWETALLSGVDATELRQILMQIDDIKTLSGLLFERPIVISLPDTSDPCIRKIFRSLNHFRRLNGVDPELVAILVKFWPLEMLRKFSYTGDSLNLIKCRGSHPRSAALIDQVFQIRKIPILQIFHSRNNGHLLSSSFSPDEMDQILKHSYTQPFSQDGCDSAFKKYMQSSSNYENLLALFQPLSLSLNFKIVARMLTFQVPFNKIRRVCFQVEVNRAKVLDMATMSLLFRACSKDDETFLLGIIMRLDQKIKKPFWGRELDELVEELGYSDEFRVKLMTSLRYTLN